MHKNISILIVLIISIFIIMVPASAHTVSYESIGTEGAFTDQFSEIDVIVAVACHVKTFYDSEYPSIQLIEPLYNLLDEVIAYKVYMTDDSYIVVNANKANPVIIEFSDPGMTYGDQVSTLSSKDLKYYLAPSVILDQQEIYSLELDISKYSNNCKEESFKSLEKAFSRLLNTPNADLAVRHDTILQMLNDSINKGERQAKSDKDKEKDPYSFLIGYLDMPNDETFRYKYLRGVRDITNWGTTSEFDNLASNHCAATSAFNVTHYFRTRFADPIEDDERLTVFNNSHAYIGNGPVTPSQYRTRYLNYINNGTSYSASILNPYDSWANYKDNIQDGYVVLMCVWPELFSAHMINGVGYLEFPSGNYCAVLDNWNSSGLAYTLFGEELYDMFCIKLTQE